MESVAAMVPQWLKDKQANLAKMAEQRRKDHLARMALLPPDTCENCYGDGCHWCRPQTITAPGVPYEFREVRLDSYGPKDGQHKAVTKARDFLESRSRDLYLTGGVGAGKTRLACALANDAHRRHLMVEFWRVPLLLHSLQPGREHAAEVEARLMEVHVAVFDDLGAERDQATDYTRRTLLMLYEARHDKGLRTVFTSNKTLQELSEMQDDDRLASRLAGRADVVRLTTADQRIQR